MMSRRFNDSNGPRWVGVALLVALGIVALSSDRWFLNPAGTGGDPTVSVLIDDEHRVLEYFADRVSGQVVTIRGTVQANLADDDNGSRHQRFIVRLESGHTLLVAHNIDLAPRAPVGPA